MNPQAYKVYKQISSLATCSVRTLQGAMENTLAGRTLQYSWY